MVIALASQFHVYLPWGFQPGEGPSRGLLRDCEIFGNLRITLVSSSKEYTENPYD